MSKFILKTFGDQTVCDWLLMVIQLHVVLWSKYLPVIVTPMRDATAIKRLSIKVVKQFQSGTQMTQTNAQMIL